MITDQFIKDMLCLHCLESSSLESIFNPFYLRFGVLIFKNFDTRQKLDTDNQ